MRTALAAAALVAGSLLVAAPASADTPAPLPAPACKAEYRITSVWQDSSGAGVSLLGQVTVLNAGATPTKGWQVSWRYADGTRITQVWGAVPLPVIANTAIVGAHAFGNEKYNGTLPPRGATVFGFAATRPAYDNQIPVPEVTCKAL